MGILKLFLRALGLRRHRSSHYYRQSFTADLPRQAFTILTGRCYVVDGDTIVIANTKIRLAGIDAPEVEDPWGKKAKWEMMQLCKYQVVQAVFDGNQSHDRNVATCYLPDGRDLSAELVKLGLAIDWPKYSGGKYRIHEPPDVRRKLWRCDARQRGQYVPEKRL